MSNPLKWYQHALRIVLEGGRGVYEEILMGLLLGEGGGQQRHPADSPRREGGRVVKPPSPALLSLLSPPLRLASDSDHLASLSPPALFHILTHYGEFSPRDTHTEASTFLLFTLAWDALHTLAVNHARVSAQSRPTPPVTMPSFLPAILSLTPRILAHPALQTPIHTCSATGRTDGVAAHVPLWGFSNEDGDFATWRELNEL